MKLIRLLQEMLSEVGDGLKDPYPAIRKKTTADMGSIEMEGQEVAQYTWTTENGTKYVADISKQYADDEFKDLRYDILFGIVSEKTPKYFKIKNKDNSGDVKYSVTNKDNKIKTGNPYRVMATMLNIVNQEIYIEQEKLERKVKEIVINPTKREDKQGQEDIKDTRRANFYKAYIQQHMPAGSKFTMDEYGKEITITLPKNYIAKKPL